MKMIEKNTPTAETITTSLEKYIFVIKSGNLFFPLIKHFLIISEIPSRIAF